VRRVAAVVGCVLAGLAAGGIWTLLQPDRYRADARVLVKPANPAVETPAETSLIATNVSQTLRLRSRPVPVDAGERERARQIDAVSVEFVTQRAPQRLAGRSLTALDPSHVAEQTSPTAGRNLLIAGLVGLAVGAVLAAALRTGARARAAPDPDVEQRLQSRIDEVALRERALAQRASRLAVREQDVERRQQEVAAGWHQAHELSKNDPALARREADLQTRAAEPQPDAEPDAVPVGTGWNLRSLEDLVAARTDVDPAQLDEWNTYLFYLREHADYDGRLPATFDSVVALVFGDLPLTQARPS
jgi:hypothetical protein